MAKTEKCDVCGVLFDPRGIKSHRQQRHPDAPKAPKGKASEGAVSVPAPSNTSAAAPASTPGVRGGQPENAPKVEKDSVWWFGGKSKA